MIRFCEYQNSDLHALISLMNQWSPERRYDPEWLTKHIATIRKKSDNRIFLAKDEAGNALGYAEVGPSYFTIFEPYFEVFELMVDEAHRSSGIGAFLLGEIERTAREQGFSKIRLHSRIDRDRAHQFYRGNGYTEFKTSRFFEKNISL